MKNKTLFIFILMMIVLVNIITAVPPITSEFVGDTNLVVEANVMNYYKTNEGSCVHIFVFNKSSGAPLDNNSISCRVELTDHNGTVMLIGVPTVQEDHFKMCRNKSIVNSPEVYGLTIVCNSSIVGGYKTFFFEANEIGIELPKNIFSIILGIAIIMLFFGIVGYLSDMLTIKSFGYGIALIQLVNIVFILYLNESNRSLISILRINFWSIFILAFGIGMIGLIMWTMKLVNPGINEEEEQPKWKK